MHRRILSAHGLQVGRAPSHLVLFWRQISQLLLGRRLLYVFPASSFSGSAGSGGASVRISSNKDCKLCALRSLSIELTAAVLGTSDFLCRFFLGCPSASTSVDSLRLPRCGILQAKYVS